MTKGASSKVPDGDKAWRERVIFRLFAKAAQLPVKTASIRSHPEPEPDIRCTIRGEGPVAFELGEIVTPDFAEATNQRQPLRQRFRESYALLPEAVRTKIEGGLGGPPAVFLGFPAGTSPGQWKRAVPPILAWLAQTADQLKAGEVPVWRIENFRDLVDEMRVQRASGRTASLHVIEMTGVDDETQALLEKKFSKRYNTRVPIELVAYYISQPPAKPDRLTSIAAFVKEHLGASPFRRVWLFNHFRTTIPLVYPAPITCGHPGAGGPDE